MAEEEEVPWNKRPGKQKQLSFGFYHGDLELLTLICDYLGCSQAEAVRTGLRMLAGQLQLHKEGTNES